jgi:rifampin ADP-ribosylating transferase
MSALPERIHAFAFDQRGHGDAAKPTAGYELRDFAGDVGAFMDAVGLDAAVLVGASSGGYVAQRFAVDNPDRTLGLALLGCPRSLCGPRPRFADAVAALVDPIDPTFARDLNAGMVEHELPEAVMAVLCDDNLKVPARVWRDALDGLLDAEPPLDTGRISAPALIVWGARDSLLPRADQEAMATEIQGARLVIYDDVGHLPVIEAPERVAADVTALCDAVTTR